MTCGAVMREPDAIAFGVPPSVSRLLQAAPIAAVLVAVMLVCAIFGWRNRYWRVSGRLHYTLVALAGVGLVWFLYHWNLLG